MNFNPTNFMTNIGNLMSKHATFSIVDIIEDTGPNVFTFMFIVDTFMIPQDSVTNNYTLPTIKTNREVYFAAMYIANIFFKVPQFKDTTHVIFCQRIVNNEFTICIKLNNNDDMVIDNCVVIDNTLCSEEDMSSCFGNIKI